MYITQQEITPCLWHCLTFLCNTKLNFESNETQIMKIIEKHAPSLFAMSWRRVKIRYEIFKSPALNRIRDKRPLNLASVVVSIMAVDDECLHCCNMWLLPMISQLKQLFDAIHNQYLLFDPHDHQKMMVLCSSGADQVGKGLVSTKRAKLLLC